MRNTEAMVDSANTKEIRRNYTDDSMVHRDVTKYLWEIKMRLIAAIEKFREIMKNSEKL